MSRDILIRPLDGASLGLFDEHFARHRQESGRGDYHFMPYEPGGDQVDGPSGLNSAALQLALDAPGWERWWIAVCDGRVVGHVNLKGSRLRTALHRADLGIGIERAFRGDGLGHRLMATAIEFCQRAEKLDWLDLNVFAHNANARALYEGLGFEVIGEITDRFRIGEESIADVIMTLSVQQRSGQ